MNDERALSLVRGAFAPFHAGATMSELRSIVFQVVDENGNGVMARHVIREEVWKDQSELVQSLTALREMLEAYGERTLNPSHA